MGFSHALGAALVVVRVQGDCSLERVDAAGLSWKSFKKLQKKGRPFVVRSLASAGLALTKEEVLERYGDSKVQLESGIDESAAFFRLTKEWRSLREYVLHPTGEQELVFEHGFVGNLSRSIWSQLNALPEMLQRDVAFPILTLGNNRTGTSLHQHEETWLWLMHGRKAWWIAKGDHRTSFARRNPCQNLRLDVPIGFQFCVQEAGDLLYFPDDSFHATCNLDTFVWGVGSQGSNAGWPSLVTSASLGHAVETTGSRAAYAAALQRALGFGHHILVRKLMDVAADFRHAPAGEAVGYSTSAPIHAVAESGDVELSKQLLSAGFDAEEPHSKVGFIALEISSYLGHVGMVDLLARQAGPLMETQRSTLLANSLRNAAQNGHVPVIRHLVQLGASPLLADGEERTALHMAAAGGQLAALQTLHEILGERAGHAVLAPDHGGHTPLHAASERGHARVVRQLLKWRANIAHGSKRKSQALHFAARQGHSPVLRLLLKKRADVEARDETGATPLMLAVSSGCQKSVKLLLKSGARIYSRNIAGDQAIHFSTAEDVLIVDLLLEWKADVHAPGAAGLSWAQRQGQTKMVAQEL